MRCLALCDASGLSATHALALLGLARINLALGETNRAGELAGEAMPDLLQHADVEKQGDAWMVLAQVEVGGGDLKRAKELLSRAGEAYGKCASLRGGREAAYMAAIVGEMLGEAQERDAGAEAFMRFGEEKWRGSCSVFVA
jgi:hypothetical protein